VDQEVFFNLTEQIRQKDGQAVITLFNQILDEGADVSEFVNSLNLHFRNLLLSKLGLASEQVLELPQAHVERYKRVSTQYEEKDLLRMLKIVQDLGVTIRNSDPKISTEIALLRLVTLEETVKIEELLEKLRESNPSSGGAQTINPAVIPPSPNKGELKTKAIEPTEVRQGTAYAVKAETGDIQAGWLQVVEKLKKEKPSLSSFLQDVHLASFDEKELHLEFAGDRAFQKQLVEKRENLSYLQKIAEEVLGTPYKIKLAVNSSKVSPDKPAPAKQTKPDIEELKQKDPLLKDILDTFQGEVI
jgi:DNA polymerase III gamma/tau subunit